jgi:NAD(P)-dependent dehydrogenase (short-subunit alcohol dehydrogenase family)
MKSALITGGGSGIGTGIAERFARGGYAISVFDINGARATAVSDRLNEAGSAIALQGDVADPSDAARAVDATLDAFGSLDVLVNNAGIEIAGSVATLELQQWDRLIAVNLRGAYLFSKCAIPKMKWGSSIIHISSVHAFASYRDCAAYDASKAALIGLTRAMALDHGADGIRVNAVCPGYIDTPLMEQWLKTVEDREAAVREVLKWHPLGRIGTPADVAEAVYFLASESAEFISGTSLVVDGAMIASGK